MFAIGWSDIMSAYVDSATNNDFDFNISMEVNYCTDDIDVIVICLLLSFTAHIVI